MNEDISEAIIDGTIIRHKFLKSRSIEDRKAYNKQRNYCASLTRKIKKGNPIILIIRRLLTICLFGNMFTVYEKPLRSLRE